MLSPRAKQQDKIISGIEREFFFSSPRNTVAGKDLLTVELPKNPSSEVVLQKVQDAIGAFRSASQSTVVVGALPFAPTSRGALFIPQRLTIHPTKQWIAASSVALPERRLPISVREVPSAEVFEASVIEVLKRLPRDQIETIVLARALDLELPEPVDIGELLQILLQRNPTGFTYSVPLEIVPQRSPHLFIGASPELLVQRFGGEVIANPLAGSAPRSRDPRQDQANADALLRSEKDLREHAVVVTAVRHTLETYCSPLDVPSAPTVLATPTMWHLSTKITGHLADPCVSVLELALALHPTPAVCGNPTDKARAAIAEIEPFERGLYAGLVGWMSAAGDGEWAVAIRCAEIRERWLRLFAGAGIIEGSRPEDEFSETTGKLRTLLSALGIDEMSVNQLLQCGRQYQ